MPTRSALAWRASGRRGDARALPQILAALDDVNPEVREAAVASLPQYGAMALESLDRVLRFERDSAVRLAAIQVLGQIQCANEQTVVRLSGLLNEPDTGMPTAVVSALARAEGPAATDGLHAAANDPDPGVRIAALQALVARVHDGGAAEAVTGSSRRPGRRGADGRSGFAEGVDQIGRRPKVTRRGVGSAVLAAAAGGGAWRGLARALDALERPLDGLGEDARGRIPIPRPPVRTAGAALSPARAGDRGLRPVAFPRRSYSDR